MASGSRESLPQDSSLQDCDEETDSDEEHSGMRLPSLLKQLHTILREYPDSSQIIKELIQNADDAEATQMKVCYESCPCHPNPEQKWSKYFAAPALCFFNDAQFSKKDWDGIRTIYSSVKEEDPLKVGRFGLGFKSIFHVTDYPTIISGDRLLVIDPLQRDPNYVCWTKKLKKALNMKTSLSAIFGKFGFTEHSLESGNFSGTLFWFPLRQQASALSNNMYSNEKISDLLHSFKAEASVTLLFLKSLEKIEWFDGSDLLYSVQVNDTNGQIRSERNCFQQQINDSTTLSSNVSKTEMSIETKSCSDEKLTQRWLVVNLFKREELSDEMKLLLEDKSLAYPPYVGVAVPLNMDMSKFKGHVFCFLPLPLEAKSITGLPVHVNGFFALSQNRRHVNWSCAGEKRNNCISWNECLVKELLPEAYNILLQTLVEYSKDNSNRSEIVPLVYKSIPDESCVLANWNLLLDPLYTAILKENFLFTINNSWVDSANCILPPVVSLDEVILKVIWFIYQQAGEHLVEVPEHVMRMLQTYVSGGVKTVSPDHLRSILLSSASVYKDLSICEKLYILAYLTCDEKYNRLEGLELLPLNNQEFLTFHKVTEGDRLFHCSPEEIKMFPGLGHMIVMSDFPDEVPVMIVEQIRCHLINIACQEVYQINQMMQHDAPELIMLTIQKNSEQKLEAGRSVWCTSDNTILSDSWIDNIWEYLGKHFDDLELFSEHPIVPYNKLTGEKRLYKLSETMILKTSRGADSLSQMLCQALECLGVLVVPSLRDTMLSHPCLLGRFVKGPSVHGVVQIISRCSDVGITNFNNICSSGDKRALVKYLGGITEIPESALCILRRLELFLQSVDPAYYASVEKCRNVAPEQKIPIPVKFPRPLLYPKNIGERQLAILLGCSTILLEELVTEILHKIVSMESESMEQSYYSTQEIQTFMMYFLKDIKHFDGLTEYARNVKFLGEDLNIANELYDPNDSLLQHLFLHESRFPNKPFDSHSSVSGLKKLGLRSSDNIHQNDLLKAAQCIHENIDQDGTWTKKSKAILTVLEKYPDLLQDLTLNEGLRDLRWVTPVNKRGGYPDVLPRHGSTSMCRPSDMCSNSYIHIVGSVMPLVSTTCKQLLSAFGWDQPPSVNIVLKQLDIVSQHYQTRYKPKLFESICLIYQHLSGRMEEISEEHRMKLNQSNCVWTGDGFSKPSSVYMEPTGTDIDLKPYLFLLPPELNECSAFFRTLDCYNSQTTDALLAVQEAIRLKSETMGHSKTKSQKDLQIIIQILNELKQKPLGISDKQKILFPICTPNVSELVLMLADDCTYCDAKWLQEFSEEDNVILVHENVPNSTAEALGVQSLMQDLFSDAEGIQEWGQQEPLTTRLHSLLEGYSDGFSVLKEIVQNADDAGATEVRFLYDERENEKHRSCLIDEEMAECQGPALWAYNDAEFTDSDFENITNLCGATKEMDNTKIGKFGLGFSAVYNLTDVPSIVSRNEVVIFDPHMKYLGKLIAGKQPGLKIDVRLMKNKVMLRKMKNQFWPYNGVFNCDILGEKSNFSGTLFRFPLRTENQAMTSKISKMIYSRQEMKKLLKIFMESAANLLLFTQHVKVIQIFHLNAENSDPENAVLMYEVKRQVVDEMPQTMPQMIKNMDIMPYVSSLIKNEDFITDCMQFEMCYGIKIQVTILAVRGICNLNLGSHDSYWIISWAIGTNESLHMALKSKIGALPLGGVAIPVTKDGEHFLPCQLAETPTGFYKDGHAFCFLPLPIKTNLPVHINGCFALTSDRRHLCSRTEDDKECYGYEWNQALLKDAVCRAYLLFIERLQNINLSNKYVYHQLWPTSCDRDFIAVARQFFTTVATDNLTVFCREGLWSPLNNCLFLDDDLKSDDDVAHIAFSALSKSQTLVNGIVLDLPSEINNNFKSFGCEELIEGRTVTLEQFYKETFLQSISAVCWNAEERNKLLLFAIDNANIRHMLNQYKCIPCRPDEQLRCPHELIDPHSSVACLFDEDDGRFPIGDEKTFLDPSRKIILKKMGMMDRTIPEDLLIEQAMSVQTLAGIDSKRAFKKCFALLDYLKSGNTLQSLTIETLQKIRGIKFLPVMPKPLYWPLCWGAEQQLTNTSTDTVWAEPGSLFCQKTKLLVGSQSIIVDDLQLDMKIKKQETLLYGIGVQGIDDVLLETVLDNLTMVSQIKFECLDIKEGCTIKAICNQTYQYLDSMCSKNDHKVITTVVSRLADTECVWTDEGFRMPNMVLLSHHVSDLDVCPHMCYLTHESKQCLSFFRKLGCHEHQTADSLLNVMRRIRHVYEQDSSQSKEAVQRDLRIIIQILNNMKQYKSEIDPGELLFPTCLSNESKLVLKPASECTYCDAGWLQDLTEDDDHLILVHPDVSNSTAEALGVESLTQSLLSDTEGIQEWGQKEPLTRRLHHLLEGYSDGYSIPKEILQNADDAGASEVCFLYDERENEEARTGLIDKGMAECQGPALWAYNDAEFTDADFKNIGNLSGATKENNRSKIGKFGLGFSAVYNLTDVPSIVSKNTAVIFDPHMKYLGKAVKGREPGIKINLVSVKNKLMLKKMKNQFKPYKGVFGCDITSENHSYFHGTLFRFPLRTKDQAIVSDICKIAYDKYEMKKLLKMFMESAGNLLLFSQHVHNIKLFHLPAGENDPSCAELLMEVKKENLEAISHSDDKKTFMQLAADAMEQVKNNQIPKSIPIKLCGQLRIGIQYQSEKSDLIDASLSDSESQWIIAWATGTKLSLELALKQTRPGNLPLGSVAMLVKEDEGLIIPCDVTEATDGFYKQGHIFCFLPLPLKTSLPLHINGCFAVASDRRSLSHPTEDDKIKDYSNDWNEAVMADAVCNAYLLLLEKLQEFGLSPDYKYYQFWPTKSSSRVCDVLSKQLYLSIANKSPKVFHGDSDWQALENCLFLEPDFRSNKVVGDIAHNALVHFESSTDVAVIDLPRVIFTSFKNNGCQQEVQKSIVSVELFFEKVFFPNIHSEYWTDTGRNALTCFALDNVANISVGDLVRKHRCIPCKPDGELKYPSEVVQPKSFVACMFGESDGRFPSDSKKQSFCTQNRLAALQSLGMMQNTIPVNLLVDRVQSVVILNMTDEKSALDRCVSVLKYLAQISLDKNDLLSEISSKLKNIPFLPVLKKPDSWPVQWQADTDIYVQQSNINTVTMQLLASGSEIFVKSAMDIVGALKLVLDTKCFAAISYSAAVSHSVSKILGITMKEDVPLDVVAQQLLLIASTYHIHGHQTDNLEKICFSIYEYLSQKCSGEDKENDIKIMTEILQNHSILYLNKTFVQPCKTAYQRLQCDCSPELFSLPVIGGIKKFKNFLDAVGVKQNFDPNDINDVIHSKQEEFGSKTLPKTQLNLICNLVTSLAKVKETNATISQPVYMPDNSGVLRNVNDLCRDDCELRLNLDRLHIVHSNIAPNDAEILGVQTMRRQSLKHYSRGLRFGQSEKLAIRLKHLINAYPCGIEIMKELLQNADDAGASKLHFIKDFRQHPCEKVFDESWKPLQGPALCVYNDSSFTRADIEGIQKLGEGSKGEDPTKTGQYGVGFNAVYHLTDVPSFLTKGKNVDGRETLCVLDPHCLYVPGATAESPGEQYVNLTSLRTEFPDVFHCYPDEMFFGDSGTLFRFPLRDDKMAKCSELKDQPINQNEVNELIENFKKEMIENLLFVNNVTSIAIYNMTANGLEEEYVVTASMSEDCKSRQQDFFNYMQSMAQKIKTGSLNICEIEKKQVAYQMNLSDNKGLSQTWCVVQQLGFSNGDDIPEKVQEALSNNKLGLLPRGGVAFPLPEVSGNHVKLKLQQSDNSECTSPLWQSRGEGTVNRPSDIKDRQKKQDSTAPLAGKAFCFLPLPESTGLPVHVNGHFSLDHESRRNLWNDNSVNLQCFRSLWNRYLNEDVISDCYVSALHQLKLYLFQEYQPETYGEREIHNRLSAYLAFFPILRDVTGEYWKKLTSALYKHIDSDGEKLFPVIQNDHTNLQEQYGEINDRVEWVGLKAVDFGKFQSFFSDIKKDISSATDGLVRSNRCDLVKKTASIRQILKKLGMKLIDCPMKLFHSIKDSGVSVEKLQAYHVRDFIKSFKETSLLDHCRLMVDVPLAETVLQNTHLVQILLEYCNLDGNLSKHLDDLPLLVTQDQVLRVFKTDNPVFSSKFCKLISDSTKLHLFLDHSLVQWSGSFSVFERFTVETFVEFLPDTLDASKYKCENYIPWNPQESAPSESWIETVWSFFLDDLSHKLKDKNVNVINQNDEERKRQIIEDMLHLFENWCLYPACNGSNKILVPVCEAKIVLCVTSFRPLELCKTLEKLNLPQPCLDFSKEVNNHLLTMATIFWNANKAKDFIYCLFKQNKMLMDAHLSCSEAKCIIQLFNDELDQLCTTLSMNTLVYDLKSLPLYETAAGQLTMLPQNCTTLVIHSNMPKEGLEKWAEQSNVKLLKQHYSLDKLHTFLGCSLSTTEELYYSYIIPKFNNLPQNVWIFHIAFMKDQMLGLVGSVFTTEFKTRLIKALKNLSFLQGKNEQLYKASNFFSPFQLVFEKMLQGDDFPPAPYCKSEWRNFMEMIGMKSEVTADMFVSFAQQLEQEGKRVVTDAVKEKSKILVEYLFAHDKIWKVLHRISNIHFLMPHEAGQQYTDICPQKACTQNLIAFSDSVSPTHVDLSWTTYNIFLLENDPARMHLRQSVLKMICEKLGICLSPSLDNIILHIQNVCESLKTLLDSPDKRHNINTVVIDRVMESFYTALQQKLENSVSKDKIKQRLQHTPIVFLKGDNCMVSAHQTVQHLLDDEEIKPYLVKAPIRYGKFFPLFEHLGTEAISTANHFAEVLHVLQQYTEGETLHPNELETMCKAVRNLFKKLHHKNCEKLTVDKLYLPSKEKNLVLSTELVFPDDVNYEKRIVNQDEVTFIAGFDKLKMEIISPLDEIKKIPTRLRPKMLTCLISEELINISKTIIAGDKTRALQNFVHCPDFSIAVLRLIQHQKDNERETEDEDQEPIRDKIQYIKIAQVSIIETQLKFQNQPIPDSRSVVECFTDIDKNGDRKEQLFYISEEAESDIVQWTFVISKLLQLMVQCVHSLLQKCDKYLIEILNVFIHEPKQICAYLDKSNIRQYNSPLDFMESFFPCLGSIILQKLHHLLDNSFCEFSDGEYVALEMFDNEIDPNSTDAEGFDAYFIYAKVIKMVETGVISGCMTKLLQKYLVDIGNKEMEVLAINIYKFDRKKISKSKELVAVETASTPQSTLSLDQIKLEIKNLLKETWLLPEDQRKRIIKRLIFKWHPDKNYGNEDMCTKVFQFIKNILARLENGESLDEEEADGAFGHQWTARSYYNFGERMFQRGRSYASHSTAHGHHAFYYDYKYEPQPNPMESRRWMRQAKCDLEAAKNTINVTSPVPCHNWVCYKCQQSAEKALKAAWLARDSRKVDKRNHDLPSIASGLGEELEGMARELQDLIGEHTRMRYPDLDTMPNIPSDIYNQEMAEQACEIANNIVNSVAASYN